MQPSLNQLAIAAGTAASLVFAALPAAAQGSWPTQPIKFIVPNPPGGLPDILSRALADSLRARLGQPIIVENRPGANAGIGAAAVATSKPDGYTFLVSDSAIINISHHLNAQLPFNQKDLEPAVLIAKASIFLATNVNLPINTFKEMIDHVRANPGKISYGSIGVGSFHHLSMEAVQAEYKLQLNHIPYKGSGETLTALRAGTINLVFSAFAGLNPVVKSGHARLLASNGAARTKQAPDVPTIGETIPGYDLSVTQSLYARTGTPKEISERLTKVMAEVVKEPAIIERFNTLGIEASVDGSAGLKSYLAAEAGRIEKIVKAAGLKPN